MRADEIGNEESHFSLLFLLLRIKKEDGEKNRMRETRVIHVPREREREIQSKIEPEKYLTHGSCFAL